MDDYDCLLKFILIGDAGSGKSCLLRQFVENRFNPSTSHTIGVEFGSRTIEIDSRRCKLQLWDTAGQERYRSVTRSYYRGAVACLVVYDITNRDSFQHLINWLQDARALANENVAVVVCGNKSDLKERREVTYVEASRLCQEKGFFFSGAFFFETSAMSGENVEEVFFRAAREVLQSQTSVQTSSGTRLVTETKTSCCA